MCTVSWQLEQERYTLFFNRDERRARAEADPPVPYRCGSSGAEWLAPIDPEGGGTWVFVNSRGLCAVILNHYSALELPPAPEVAPRSRGRLLFDLAASPDVKAFARSLEAAVRQAGYRPCLLLAIDPENGPVLHRWTGVDLERQPIAVPFVTTSSVRTETVEKDRLAAFHRHVANPQTPHREELDRLHRWHDPHDGARSVLMTRPDARTVSRTVITVGRDDFEMSYRSVRAGTPPTLNAPHVKRLARMGSGVETISN